MPPWRLRRRGHLPWSWCRRRPGAASPAGCSASPESPACPCVVLMTKAIPPRFSRSTMCGEPSATLFTISRRDAIGGEVRRRAARRDELEAHRVQPPGQTERDGLVLVPHADEHAAAAWAARCRRPPAPWRRPCGVLGDAHHLAGGAHLRPEDRVHPGEAPERETPPPSPSSAAGAGRGVTPSSSSVLPAITSAATFASDRPVALDTNGTVRRGARVHLEDVDLVVLDGELHVHQARPRPARARAVRVCRSISRDQSRRQRVRRQDAGASRPSARRPPRCAPSRRR